jgi:Protein of unknown function (DUF2510)
MTTSPPPQPPAGWYPDPTGKPGEMYWDGEAWHSLTPGTRTAHNADDVRPGLSSPPDIPATGESDGTRSGNKLAVLLIGGLLLMIAGVWFVAYPLGVVAKLHAPPSPSPGSQQSQSPYYQEGYNSGTSGLARKGYGDNMYNTGATVAEMEHQACANAINNESNLASIQDSDHPANQDNYMDGCLNAFRDHPPTAKPKPGPLNPYR